MHLLWDRANRNCHSLKGGGGHSNQLAQQFPRWRSSCNGLEWFPHHIQRVLDSTILFHLTTTKVLQSSHVEVVQTVVAVPCDMQDMQRSLPKTLDLSRQFCSWDGNESMENLHTIGVRRQSLWQAVTEATSWTDLNWQWLRPTSKLWLRKIISSPTGSYVNGNLFWNTGKQCITLIIMSAMLQ